LLVAIVFSGTTLSNSFSIKTYSGEAFYLSDQTNLEAKELLARTIELEEKENIKVPSIQKSALALQSFTAQFAPTLANLVSSEQLTNSIANATYKYISINSGMRREQVAEDIGEELGWGNLEKAVFVGNVDICPLYPVEGHLSSGTYLIDKNTNPQDIRDTMVSNFKSTLSGLKNESIYSDNEIITIASFIEREAGGEYDRKIISGIIWNRLAKNMKLDLDASLQYAKAETPFWWPTVKPKDKFIDSPYNTYRNKGLPPTPIATPSQASILAALQPQKTSCIYYFHDAKGRFNCSRTYEEHKAKIKIAY
jgi:uncharacterized YceG family protein